MVDWICISRGVFDGERVPALSAVFSLSLSLSVSDIPSFAHEDSDLKRRPCAKGMISRSRPGRDALRTSRMGTGRLVCMAAHRTAMGGFSFCCSF